MVDLVFEAQDEGMSGLHEASSCIDCPQYVQFARVRGHISVDGRHLAITDDIGYYSESRGIRRTILPRMSGLRHLGMLLMDRWWIRRPLYWALQKPFFWNRRLSWQLYVVSCTVSLPSGVKVWYAVQQDAFGTVLHQSAAVCTPDGTVHFFDEAAHKLELAVGTRHALRACIAFRDTVTRNTARIDVRARLAAAPLASHTETCSSCQCTTCTRATSIASRFP